jgi:4-amino-4-deoxy-L-arabinose transferase-like glycosyltransferase
VAAPATLAGVTATLRTPTATRSTRRRSSWAPLALACVTLFGVALRASAFTGGWLRFPVDYDEGVYSAAGQLLAGGHVPYRDFTFVHPPGIAYLFAVLAPLGPYRAVVAARLLAVCAAGCSTALLGNVVRKAWGATPAVVGAAVYAVFPEVVLVEHGAFIEPWLNLTCIATLACWQRAQDELVEGRASWSLAAGACAGLAIGLKLWAVIPVAALALAWPIARAASRRAALLGLAASSLLIWLPVVILAGQATVWRSVVAFHLSRPPDGVTDRAERLWLLAGGRHAWLLAVLAGLAVGLAVWRRWRPGVERGATVWLAGLSVLFIISAAYWDQYNAALAPPLALLVAYAVHRATPWPRRQLALLALAVLAGLLCARTAWRESRAQAGEPAAVTSLVRQLPADATVCSFEPAWLLAADRVPPVGAFPPVDSYASTITEPLSPASFTGCAYLAVGGRGRWETTPDVWRWVEGHYRPVDDDGLVWERLSQ